MKAWPLVFASLASLLAPAVHAQEKKPLNVCLISGSFEYESDKSLAKLKDILENIDWICVCRRAFLDRCQHASQIQPERPSRPDCVRRWPKNCPA